MRTLYLKQLKELREKAKTVQEHIQFQNQAQVLWAHISDHDILNKKMGLSALKYFFEPDAQGGSWTYAQARVLGFLKTTYLELPPQWLPPRYFAVERIFEQGLFQYFCVEKWLEDLETGGCRVKVCFHYVPRYSFIPLKGEIKRILHKMLQAMAEIDTNLPLQNRLDLGFETFFQTHTLIKQNIRQLLQAWAFLMPKSTVPEKVAEFIHTAPDKYVQKLRPFEIADYFELPRLEVLTFCLLATKHGFLDLSWDVLCPSCRGSKGHNEHLWHLNSEVHCDTCNIQYSASFEQNVEVTFTPKKIIRRLDKSIYCFANPAMTRHIWAQVTLDPEETREITLYLPVGKYRLCSLSLKGGIIISVPENSTPQHTYINLEENLAMMKTLQLAEQTTLTLHNPSKRWITLKIEKLNYHARIATAAFVTSLQDFRDLFSHSQVLRPGMQLGLSNIAILFSDLVGSTHLYEHKGDSKAFALVQKHFDIMIPIIRQHQGGVIKTMGDAVMAIFTDNQAAFQASLEILQAFAQHNQQSSPDEQITIKLGLHKGSCILLNLNEKLDYFGNTINLAARIQGTSQGNDVVISEELFKEVQAQIVQYPSLSIIPFVVELKGIQKQNTLYRLCFTKCV